MKNQTFIANTVGTGSSAGENNSHHLQKIIDTSPDLICTCNASGFIIQMNQACNNLLGYAPDDVIQKHFTKLIAAEDVTRTLGLMAKAKSGAPVAYFETFCKHKNGAQVPVEWSVNWSEEEEVLFCIGRNLSQKKCNDPLSISIDRQLKKSVKSNNEILERITEGFFALDDEATITYWNKQAEKITQQPREKVMGRCLWDCFAIPNDSLFYINYQRAKEENKTIFFESFYTPLGLWLQATIYPTKKGISVFFKNITEKKETEEELQKLSLIAAETTNPILITDVEARILWINKAFTTTYGYMLDEVRGHKPTDILGGPETDMATVKLLRDNIRAGINSQVELVYYTKTKQKLWLEIQCQPLIDGQQNKKLFFGIQNNITERKKLQLKLQQQMSERHKEIAYAEIKAQEKERSQIGQELHDNVNQVLTTVKLYNELCMANPALRDDLLPKSINYLNVCIEEIRNLSKALSAPTIGNITLKDSIKELVNSIEATNKISINYSDSGMEEKHFKKEIHIALFRIVQEHLTNILKHAGAREVTLLLHATNSMLHCTIQDDGIGFDVHQLFDGIGITNMKSRAEVLNGSFNLKSAPGKGCTLTVCFPLMPMIN